MTDNFFILPCLCGNKPQITRECSPSRSGKWFRIACTCELISSQWSFVSADAARLWNRVVMMCFERESEAEDRWLARKAGWFTPCPGQLESVNPQFDAALRSTWRNSGHPNKKTRTMLPGQQQTALRSMQYRNMREKSKILLDVEGLDMVIRLNPESAMDNTLEERATAAARVLTASVNAKIKSAA